MSTTAPEGIPGKGSRIITTQSLQAAVAHLAGQLPDVAHDDALAVNTIGYALAIATGRTVPPVVAEYESGSPGADLLEVLLFIVNRVDPPPVAPAVDPAPEVFPLGEDGEAWLVAGRVTSGQARDLLAEYVHGFADDEDDSEMADAYLEMLGEMQAQYRPDWAWLPMSGGDRKLSWVSEDPEFHAGATSFAGVRFQ